MSENLMCTYCGKWFHYKEMTPMWEKGHKQVCTYCDRCLPMVKGDLRTLPWHEVYHFGVKGSYKK